MKKEDLPSQVLIWPILYDPGVVDIAHSESLALVSYKCQAGRWTIGYGETDGVYPGQRITKGQADQMLLHGLNERTSAVLAMCTLQPTQHQLCALVSLSYNIGLSALRASTVIRRHNVSDSAGAARAFSLYNKYRNPHSKQLCVSDGLTARRAKESALYLMPDPDAPPLAMPQAVVSESSLATSPINISSAVTVAGGSAMTLLSAAGDQATGAFTKIKEIGDLVGIGPAEWMHSIGLHPGVMLGGLFVIAGATVIYQRRKQREGGWA